MGSTIEVPTEKTPTFLEIIDHEEKVGLTFSELMEKLLRNDARTRGYDFHANPAFPRLEIDGILEKKYPGAEKYPDVDLRAIVHFKRLTPSLGGSTTFQLENLLNKVVKSKTAFYAYILFTPLDLTEEQEKIITKFRKRFGLNIIHYGRAKVMDMLAEYPALKKYLCRNWPQEDEYNFNQLKKAYKNAVRQQSKGLSFIGLPTAQYQHPDLLKPVDLRDIYIPLKFKKGKNTKQELSLFQVLIRQPGRSVVLAGLGCGKSTLAKYLALEICDTPDDEFQSPLKDKIPFLIPLCDFAWTQDKKYREFNFIDYLKYAAENKLLKDLGISIDIDFFIAMLELGKAFVIFDGLDEVPTPKWRDEIVSQIEELAETYPESSIWVMARIFGYKTTRGLNRREFEHYYLEPVSEFLSEQFIDKWYKLQYPYEEDIKRCNEKIDELQNLFKSAESMKWFKTNPLYLTMIVILNQLGTGIPGNRALLYGKYLELLLWTWPNRKYSVMGEINPLEKRGIDYTEQLRLLCAVAAHIKEKKYNKNNDNDNTHATMESKKSEDIAPGSDLLYKTELEEIIFRERFNEMQVSEETARADCRAFIDYMVDRTGFFEVIVDGSRNGGTPVTETIYAFIRNSFIDYLYASHITRHLNKSDKEHVEYLMNFLGKSAWDEFILFSLLIFSDIKLSEFLDSFIDTAFEQLNKSPVPHAWITLGRVLRDNLKVNPEAAEHIIRKLLRHWVENLQAQPLSNEDDDIFHIVLKEIAGYSIRGKKILKRILEEMVTENDIQHSLSAFSLFLESYVIDEKTGEIKIDIGETIKDQKNHTGLLSYLPVYREIGPISDYIYRNMSEKHWVVFYNNAAERIPENLDNLKGDKMSPEELRGYIISSWSRILNTFKRRSLFLESNRQKLSRHGENFLIGSNINNISFGPFAGTENRINRPLFLFRNYISMPVDISPLKIDKKIFFVQDRTRDTSINTEQAGCFSYWATNLIIQTFSAFKKTLGNQNVFSDEEKKHIKSHSLNFGKTLSHEVLQYFNQSLRDDLKNSFQRLAHSKHPYRFLNMDFTRYLGQYFKLDFMKSINRGEFNQLFRRNINRGMSRVFSRYLARDLNRPLDEEMTMGFLDFLLKDVGKYHEDFDDYLKNNNCENLKTVISKMYTREHFKSEDEEWNENDFQLIYKLILNEFNQDRWKFIDSFYAYLYEFLFNQKFEPFFQSASDPNQLNSSDSKDKNIRPKSFPLSLGNPFMIPFIFNYVLSADLNHYITKLLAYLYTRHHEEPFPDDDALLDAAYDYYYNSPYIHYFLNYSWDFFSKRFNAHHEEDSTDGPLKLACFLVNAAKVSLDTDLSCDGLKWEDRLEWDKILCKAERSDNIFVKFSLTLYKLCNFTDITLETGKFETLLETFKTDYLEFYNLLNGDIKLD